MIDNITFKKVRKLIYDEVGINLTEVKKALVSSRLRKRMNVLNIPEYKDYIHFVKNDKSKKEIVQLFNIISTNVTHFFREKDHFDFFEKVFLQSKKEGRDRFRIWSAACSSGEEPYSIAMTLEELLQGERYDYKILGTDISTKVLNMSLQGIYQEKQMQTVSSKLKLNYFTKYTDDKDLTLYQIDDRIKRRVLFKRLNLSKPPFPLKGNLDAIFCRNVMIYFDDIVRTRLVQEFYRLLRPGGFLFIGHSESLAGLQNIDFKLIKASIYKKEL
ncbi:MAG: CheR family methyltransferase [Fidelibacterota bacterium]